MWKDVKEYEGLYMIDENGNIKNKDGYQKKINVAKNGYCIVDLYKNNIRHTYTVHRLVAQAFLDNPYNLDVVNHKDGDKTNNCVSNLEWCDYSYNLKHAFDNKLRKPVHEYMAKLSEQEVREIPVMANMGLSKAEIARYLMVPIDMIKKIFNGTIWHTIGIDFTSIKVRKKNRWEKDIVLPERYVKYLKYLRDKYRVNHSG